MSYFSSYVGSKAGGQGDSRRKMNDLIELVVIWKKELLTECNFLNKYPLRGEGYSLFHTVGAS